MLHRSRYSFSCHVSARGCSPELWSCKLNAVPGSIIYFKLLTTTIILYHYIILTFLRMYFTTCTSVCPWGREGRMRCMVLEYYAVCVYIALASSGFQPVLKHGSSGPPSQHPQLTKILYSRFIVGRQTAVMLC